MNLTRSQLTHATRVQLATLGISRYQNPGWLRKALATDFTEDQVRLFTEARHAVPSAPKPTYEILVYADNDAAYVAICKKLDVVGVGPTPQDALRNIAFCIESTLYTAEMNARGEGERVAV